MQRYTQLNTFIKENLHFLAPYLTLLALGLWFNLEYSRVEGHLILNQLHGSFADVIFPAFTKLGEWVLVVLLIILTPLISFRSLMIFLSAYILGGMVVLLGKYLIFADVVRPKTLIESIESIHLVPGVVLRSLHSFPSGHTQTGFTAFFFLSVLLKHPALQRICWVAAFLVGYSRVYISQHFVMDIMAGSFIAVCAVSFTWVYWSKKDWPWLDKRLIGGRN